MADSPYLVRLGLSEVDIKTKPTQAAFPRIFNPYGSVLWEAALADPKVQAQRAPALAWVASVRKYLTLCQAQGVFPFREDDTANTKIVEHLESCRSDIESELKGLVPDVLSPFSAVHVDRHAHVHPMGFALSVAFSFRLDDPTFKTRLTNSGFTPYNHKFHKALGLFSQIQFWHSRSSGLWWAKYTISCRRHPLVLTRLPSRRGIELFVLDKLWAPLTKASRPDHRGPRVI